MLERFGHGLPQAFFLLVQFDLRVAQDAKQRGVDQFHAGKQLVGAVPDQILQAQEPALAGRHVGLERNPGRQHGRNLHPDRDVFVGVGVAEDETPVGREIRHEGKGMRRVHSERGQRRGDVAVEKARCFIPLRLGQFASHSARMMPWPGQQGDQIAIAARLFLQLAENRLADLRKPVAGAAARTTGSSSLSNLRHAAQQSDALHVELIEVRREDREKLEPFEQRRALVQRLVQHAPVEVEPAQIPVAPGMGQQTFAGSQRWVGHGCGWGSPDLATFGFNPRQVEAGSGFMGLGGHADFP